MANRGKLFVIEGIEGSGKTTQVENLRLVFEELGHRVLKVREPGSGLFAELLRQVLLGKDYKIDALQQTLLFSAARRELVRDIIEPALEKGILILQDRSWMSTIAYQGYGQGVSIEFLDRVSREVMGETMPDRAFVIDVSIKTLRARLRQRGGDDDRFESEADNFHEKVRSGYIAQCDQYPFCEKVLGEQPVQEITRLIRTSIEAILTKGKEGGNE